MVQLLLASMVFVLFTSLGKGQTVADPAIKAEINRIKAIDNHAHPLRFVGKGEPDDNEYDALTFEEMEPSTSPLPLKLSPDNPEYVAAWHALYGYRYSDMNETHVRELLATKQRMMNERGDNYPAWVLDKLGIETMFANRVAMGRGLTAPRFRWVAFDDALIFPLSNEAAKRINPDYHSFYIGEDRLLKRYLAESNVKELPATLEAYLSRVVTPTLERQKRDLALAVKFEAAYLRSLDFTNPSQSDAAKIYERYARGGEPSAEDYKKLQDFLFRYVSREAGRMGLAVHIHCTGGVGNYYSLRNSNPLLLEQVFNDPTLRKTNFVIIHGGWPYIKEVAFLLGKPNVYADISAQTFLLYPRALSETLRAWLEIYPQKVLFGTDASPLTPEVNWEETGWLTANTAREALALALTGMMNDRDVTRQRAVKLAHMVMRDNAIKLYGLPMN